MSVLCVGFYKDNFNSANQFPGIATLKNTKTQPSTTQLAWIETILNV